MIFLSLFCDALNSYILKDYKSIYVIILYICSAYLVALYQVSGEGLWLSDQMFVLVLWNMWDKRLTQVIIDIYWLWMFWKCLILVFGDDMCNIGMTF
jgi:hypothetical protein